MRTNPNIKKLALFFAAFPLMRQLEKQSRDIRKAQDRVLEKIIDSCKNTVFGKEHGFNKIRAGDEYRKAVPVRDFEGHRNYIDRMCNGEEDILFPGKPVFYNTTSGTNDLPKLIPVSKPYFEQAYTGVSRLWFYTCLRDNPRLFDGQNLSAVAPAVEGYVNDGTPYGSISGVVYKNIPGILKDLYSTPYPVICIKDYQKKYYAMLRCALGSKITYIITVNPSTLLQFHKTVLQEGEDLVRDIRDGCMRLDVLNEIDPKSREMVLSKFRPDSKRAKWLEKLFEKYGGKLRPKHYWPDLVCINTWKKGNCSLILPKLADYFPKSTVIREFGYQASEARAGLALHNEWDYSVLLAHIYHFEFIPEESIDKENPDVLSPHELEIGKTYYILFSNGSGLYRYNINDIVCVKGFYNQFPLFEFIQKGEGITNLTGEKLSESQVIQAIDAASRAGQIHVEFYTMFCDPKNYIYKLYVEFPKQVSEFAQQAFIRSVDEHLKFINPEYSAKRGSKRLKQPILHNLVPNSYEKLKSRLLLDGLVREGQYKVSCLRSDEKLRQLFDNLVI